MPENAQHLPIRVYYEDTDFSGRVYHASYLRFMERGRTEWMRHHGLQHGSLMGANGVAFAVRRLEAEYLAAAAIDDLLDVATLVLEMKGPCLRFRQLVRRGATDLVVALVDVVAIKGERPVRPPRELQTLVAALKRQ